MADYAPTQHTGVTDTYEWLINFSYANESDVEVYVEDVLKVQGSGAGKYLFNTAGTKIVFEDGSEPQTGEILIIRRVTDITAARVIYTAGSGFTYDDINAALNQLLYAVDELQVPAFERTHTLASLIAADVIVKTSLTALPTRVEVWYETTDTDNGHSAGKQFRETHVNKAQNVRFYVSGGFLYYVFLDNTLRLPESMNVSSGAFVVMDGSKWDVHIKIWR